MKKTRGFFAVLLIFCMMISVFSETVTAKEPESEKAGTTQEVSEISDSGQAALEENVSWPEDLEETGDGQSREPDIDSDEEKKAQETDAAAKTQETEEASEEQKTDKAAKTQRTDVEPDSEAVSEDMEEKALTPEEMDDPGRGRLSGEEIPEEFYGDRRQMRAASTGITHNSRFSGYDIRQGIDVSKWNGTIDWSSVRKAGIDFAFVRTSYRGTSTGKLSQDPTAAANMKNAAAAGVKVGAYIFSQAITEKEAVEEAEYLLQTVKGYNITMPLVFDFEYYAEGRLSNKKLSRRAQTDICLAFCERILKAGYTPLVYANKSMLSSDLYASEISAKAPVWLAHYTSKTDYSGDYDFWQYTSSGKVSGISGNVDMNFWYIKPGSTISYGTGSTVSSVQNTTTPAAPAAPKLSGKASSYDKVKLSWKKVSGVSGYILYRYDSSKKKYVRIKTISGDRTVSYTDTGRSMGKSYKYKIKAYKKADGKTAYSPASSAVKVKTDSTMTGKTNGTSIAVRSGPSSSKKTIKKLGINTGVTITGTSGSWYRISIKVNGKKKTGYIKKTYITIIRKPTLSVSASSSSKIKLSWDQISGASGYEIQRYHSSKKKYVTIKTIKKGTTTSYTNSGLKKNTKYKYKIRSFKTVRGKKIYSYYCSAKSATTKK